MGIYLGPFRFTKRGVRVRIGPRAARLHVGAGGTGFSTGAGPFTWYRPLRGKRRRTPPAHTPAPPHYYASQPQPQQPDSTAPHPSGYGRTAQPPRQPWSRRKRGLIVAASLVGGLFVLLLVIGALAGPPTPSPASHHGPVVPVVAGSSPASTPSPAAETSSPAPSPSPVVTTQPAPATTTTTAAPPPPPPASCYPLTSTGRCYEPGEYCPTADAGMTGLAGDGETIVCILESGRYHWHPTN